MVCATRRTKPHFKTCGLPCRHTTGVYISSGQLFGWEMIMVSRGCSTQHQALGHGVLSHWATPQLLPHSARQLCTCRLTTTGCSFLRPVQTFVLVFVVYSCCISKPGFGHIGPLMVGYTLFASAFVVSAFSAP